MDKPLVSVLVPTYNRSRFLSRALDSILAQTYTNIEIVVVDDNIPDSQAEKDTKEVLKPYIEKGQVKCVKTPGKLGGGAARNFALKELTGDYVAFLDD